MPRLIDRAFCVRCADRMAYEIHVETEELTVHGTEFSCVEVSAKCCSCGEELYIPEVNDLNVELREGAYAKATSRPHGRWIWDEEDECWICSNCENTALNNWRRRSTASEYCPTCGAIMDLKEQDDGQE